MYLNTWNQLEGIFEEMMGPLGCLRISIAVINTMNTASWEEKCLFASYLHITTVNHQRKLAQELKPGGRS